LSHVFLAQLLLDALALKTVFGRLLVEVLAEGGPVLDRLLGGTSLQHCVLLSIHDILSYS
jgi:hypothetical protein